MTLMERRRAMMGAKAEATRILPDDYQEVEWIGSKGGGSGQRIATQKTLNNGRLRVKTKVYIETPGQYFASFLQVGAASNYDTLGFYMRYSGQNKAQAVSNGIKFFSTDALRNSPFDIDVTVDSGDTTSTHWEADFSQGNNHVHETGTTDTSSYANVLYLLGNPANGATQTKGRMYFAQVWNGNKMVLDVVPCYRKSDDVIGMYDFVSKTFMLNSGPGTFTKGPDVT